METRELAAETELQNRYHVLSTLKRGGMGRVYLAEDLRVRSRVAVKLTSLERNYAGLSRAKRGYCTGCAIGRCRTLRAISQKGKRSTW